MESVTNPLLPEPWYPRRVAVKFQARAAKPRFVTRATMSKDLLVVGPGRLGRLIAKHWAEENRGSARIVGQTRSSKEHDALRALGIEPVVRDAATAERFPFVVFCAPPDTDYALEVRRAAERWNGEGSLLFTSSSAVYDCFDNGLCVESTPTVAKGRSPRTDTILAAEEEILKVGGNAVRLAGLYSADRGAHAYWRTFPVIKERPDCYINLIHYEDAATLCVAILGRTDFRGRVFMGCDGTPMSRQEIMDVVSKNQECKTTFTGSDGPLGKKMDGSKTREELHWQPRYKSFEEFMKLHSAVTV
ncbi:hypothetical protein SELMODRAFT_438793 [Selaginella moellendorffii]|uniref:NAD(P)-binding domain-containing protein n=1 Tax=Selaginella moellendorffii TaxID=88036 RepID=D8QZH4_SELML|nr:uncharacterized protein LOC9655659 [Selaginella moellendorffii]EFJ34402.1 hypothetical protein SELMODRAFT_438793 [Selaginella moellendorffii]|eukprot:XP_002964069.1 uncharacterized protein LOC9655659 [Selaginella moellendorffii]